jgi:AcrR family transcriptional regulator
MTSPVATLSRERIVETAFTIVQRDGLAALSMRRIATELGTGTMSLYNYVPDKETLLRSLVDRVLASVDVRSRDTWREGAECWASSLRDAMLAHNALVPVIVSPDHISRLLAVGDDAVKAIVEAGRAGSCGYWPAMSQVPSCSTARPSRRTGNGRIGRDSTRHSSGA